MRGAALVALAAILLASGSAAAHGYMRASEPPANARLVASPGEVVAIMSEPILLASSDLAVLDREGKNHAVGAPYHKNGDASTLAVAVSLPMNATYVAVWTALWVSDGHLTHGGFGFVVGNASAPPPVTFAEDAGPSGAETGLRFLGFATLTLALGPLLFLALAWAPVEGAVAPRRIVRLAAGAAFAGVAVAAASALAGAGAAGLSLPEYLGTRLGEAAAARAALLAGGGALALALPARPALAAVPLLLASATFTATSHAWASGSMLLVGADFVHIVGGAAWVGGLVALLLALPAATARGPLALRFSSVALAAVALVVLTGVAAGFAHLGGPERALATDYGRVLLAKVAVVLLMMALGAVNRYVLVPAVSGTAPPPPLRHRTPRTIPSAAAPAFRRVVAVESAAGLVVLALAGLLAGTPFTPPEGPVGPFSGVELSDNGKVRRSEGMLVALAITPAAVGLNAANVSLVHAEGEAPVTTAKRVQLYLNKLKDDGTRNGSVPTQAVDLTDRGSGRFTGNVTFGLPGPWKVTVAVERSDALDDAAAFVVRIR